MLKSPWIYYTAIACGVVVAPLTIWAQQSNMPAPKRAAAVRFQAPAEDPLSQPSAPKALAEPIPAPEGPTPPPPRSRVPSGEPPLRDPTDVRPEMRRLLDPPEKDDREKLTRVSLRGRIVSPNRPAVALIEVNEQLFVIEPNSTITTGGYTLTVTKLNADVVSLKIEDLDQTFTLH